MQGNCKQLGLGGHKVETKESKEKAEEVGNGQIVNDLCAT